MRKIQVNQSCANPPSDTPWLLRPSRAPDVNLCEGQCACFISHAHVTRWRIMWPSGHFCCIQDLTRKCSSRCSHMTQACPTRHIMRLFCTRHDRKTAWFRSYWPCGSANILRQTCNELALSLSTEIHPTNFGAAFEASCSPSSWASLPYWHQLELEIGSLHPFVSHWQNFLWQARQNNINIGGGAASEASGNGAVGAFPRENFSRSRPLDSWKTPLLYKITLFQWWANDDI